MSITLKQLEAFIAVADLVSFRKAAERLNTTQPNISTRIAALEARLGVTLMERDAGSVRLTGRGEALLPPARQVLRSMDAFVTAAGDDGLFEGVLRLGVTEMIAHSWLGAFLKTLKARYPNVLVELTVDFSAALSAALFDRSLDLAFQSGPFDRPMSGHAPLDDYPMTWVAAPHLGVSVGRVSLDQLSPYPLLIQARGTLPFEQLSDHLAKVGLRGAKATPSTNMGAARQMAIDGLGVACLPAAMVMQDINDGRLMRVDYHWAPDPLHFAARYEAERAPAYLLGAVDLAKMLAKDQENLSSG